MTTYSYARVSTGRQADEGESLPTQVKKTSAYAVAMDEEVAEAFVERGVSGSVAFLDRPEGSRLWASLKAGDAIVCTKLDRMFRSALDALAMLEKAKAMGVRLYMMDMGGDVTGNGIAKLVFTILSAVAEAERDRLRERITDVKTHQRAQGRYLGGVVPFGYMVGSDGELVTVPAHQEAIERMRVMRSEGLSLRKIADKLKIEDDVTVSHKTVGEVLARV